MRQLVIAAATLAWVGEVSADGLDGERFAPAVGAEGGFVNEHPAVPNHLGWSLGLFLNVADDQVVQVDASDNLINKPVDTGLTADLVASLGLFRRIELGVGLPVHLIYEGDPYGALNASEGLGDLRFVPKIAIVRSGTLDQHFLLGVAIPISVPTGNDDALRGAGGVTLGGQLLLAAHMGRIGLGANLGYRWRSQHPVGLAWGDGISFGPWLSAGVTPNVSLRVEGFAEKTVGADVTGADFPFEVLGGVEYRRGNLALYGGASFGLTNGIGDPDLRIIVGLRYRKHGPERQGFKDSDGDGVMDKDDKAPYEAEDGDGFEDEDGAPEPDNDGDGILDGDDECPDLKGEADRRGCPAKTYVKIEDGRIFIIGKVQFETGSTQITKKSDPLLDQIAQGIAGNPQAAKIRIEGHTDDVGDDDVNQKLSEQRAAAVKTALVKRGIDAGRLETRGLGETRPIAPNASAGGRQKNRRVEFVISEAGK
ncbi:MAG: OmpA/MotB domain protein [Deltaproteobacteria bacterium]|nr:OmpA/MotB domain protein [Deltaproteobacteria bacterium]